MTCLALHRIAMLRVHGRQYLDVHSIDGIVLPKSCFSHSTLHILGSILLYVHNHTDFLHSIHSPTPFPLRLGVDKTGYYI
jgi:hypothetical protein